VVLLNWFDTHAHFAVRGGGFLAAVLARAPRGLERIARRQSEASNELVVRLAGKSGRAGWSAVGYERDHLTNPQSVKLAALAASGRGGGGGNRHRLLYSAGKPRAQRALFGQKLAFAADRKLTVIVHTAMPTTKTIDLLGVFSTGGKNRFQTPMPWPWLNRLTVERWPTCTSFTTAQAVGPIPSARNPAMLHRRRRVCGECSRWGSSSVSAAS
jgi:hypothetical protein